MDIFAGWVYVIIPVGGQYPWPYITGHWQAPEGNDEPIKFLIIKQLMILKESRMYYLGVLMEKSDINRKKCNKLYIFCWKYKYME